jgi:hypothetical protein
MTGTLQAVPLNGFSNVREPERQSVRFLVYQRPASPESGGGAFRKRFCQGRI